MPTYINIILPLLQMLICGSLPGVIYEGDIHGSLYTYTIQRTIKHCAIFIWFVFRFFAKYFLSIIDYKFWVLFSDYFVEILTFSFNSKFSLWTKLKRSPKNTEY